MKKLASFNKYVLPILNTMVKFGSTSFGSGGSKSAFVTEMYRNLINKQYDKDMSNAVWVRSLSVEEVDQFIRELSSNTISFNVDFNDCKELICSKWQNKGLLPTTRRPLMVVKNGKTCGFNVYTYKNIPVFAIIAYSSNFEAWANRIGLRTSINTRTANPSTHYVRREDAVNDGLVWINPIIVNGGDIHAIKLL